MGRFFTLKCPRNGRFSYYIVISQIIVPCVLTYMAKIHSSGQPMPYVYVYIRVFDFHDSCFSFVMQMRSPVIAAVLQQQHLECLCLLICMRLRLHWRRGPSSCSSQHGILQHKQKNELINCVYHRAIDKFNCTLFNDLI
jgi:hypothetical protein